MSSRTAVFMERHLNHFRVPFYEGLREALGEAGVRMRLLVGEGTPAEMSKNDVSHIAWAEHRPTRYFLDGKVAWMPYKANLGEGDLLVVEHANKLVANFWELLRPRRFRVAFWGHGRNMQADNRDAPLERLRRWTTVRADWYFAYTDLSLRSLMEIGYPKERVTVFNNAIDTRQLIRDRESVALSETQALKDQLGLNGKSVGMFLGSLYSQKGLDFCLETALAIRRRVPNFHWLVVGNGPDRHKVEAMASEHGWVHWVGARLGRDKAVYASLCDVLLIPSAVGLVALDSFALGKPIATTLENNHGPEIAYLENGLDAVMTQPAAEPYAEAVANLLIDRERLAVMQRRCLLKASRYTIEAMIENVRNGVLSAMRG